MKLLDVDEHYLIAKKKREIQSIYRKKTTLVSFTFFALIGMAFLGQTTDQSFFISFKALRSWNDLKNYFNSIGPAQTFFAFSVGYCFVNYVRQQKRLEEEVMELDELRQTLVKTSRV